jgi:hypothetical protein
MRLSFTSRILSFDLAILEPLDEDDGSNPRAVAGAPWSADTTIAAALDPLQQTDELPGDRRGFGITR